MKDEYLHYPADHFTATINEWKPLLANDHYKKSFAPTQNQVSFMKFAARQLLLSLVEDDKDFHASFKVNKYDRDYLPMNRIGVKLTSNAHWWKSSIAKGLKRKSNL
jgi:hypothetical protein